VPWLEDGVGPKLATHFNCSNLGRGIIPWLGEGYRQMAGHSFHSSDLGREVAPWLRTGHPTFPELNGGAGYPWLTAQYLAETGRHSNSMWIME